MYRKEDFSITIRHYGETYSAHCWHRTEEGYGHSWSNFTKSEDNHWEMLKTHIRVHHIKTEEEANNGRVDVARQDLKISDQRKQLDSMRSILGHLQAFAKDGWFDVKGDGTHWVMADSILEILAAVEEIVNASKSDDVPFGINRLGNAAIVDLRHKNGSFVPFDGHPLDY